MYTEYISINGTPVSELFLTPTVAHWQESTQGR